MTTDLIAQARSGDEEAFRRLTDPYRRELLVHCYRFLGSVQDAEDTLQETMLAAWRGLGGFEARASIRTWLFRVATNQCLKTLRSIGRRPHMSSAPPAFEPPEPTRQGEVAWLEPYPDVLLNGVTDTTAGPEARYEAKEAISLAFVTAVQMLPPRQRAVLILRDVLGFRASEVAEVMDSTEESVTSALKRARATLRHRLEPSAAHEPPPPPNSAVEQELIRRLTHAYETSDVDAVVALLTDDVWLSMPPMSLEYQGREVAARFHATVTFRHHRVLRLVPTRANGQPAFAMYVLDPHTGVFRATALVVLTLAGDRVCRMTAFDTSVLARFGLPRMLPDQGRPRRSSGR